MINDIVHQDGSSWVATKVISLRNPPPSEGWLLVAAKGNDGSSGRDGREGSVGKCGAGVSVGGESGEVLVKNSSNDYDTRWSRITPYYIGAASIDHRHDISDVRDLEGRLSMASPKGHVHSADQITGLKELLDAKVSARHMHLPEDIAYGPMSAQSLTVSDLNPLIYLRNNDSGDTAAIENNNGTVQVLCSGGVSIVVNGHNAVNIGSKSLSVDGDMIATKVRCSSLFMSGPTTFKIGMSGDKGQFCWDNDYLYLNIGKGIWKRIRLEESK